MKFYKISCLLVFISCTNTLGVDPGNKTSDELLFQELKWEVSENGTIKVIDSRKFQSIHIVQQNTNSTFLQIDKKNVELKDEVIDLNLNRIIEFSTPNLGRMIAIEYFFLGASGRSASIINTAVYKTDNNESKLVLDYNSFYGGFNLLSYQDDALSLSLYERIVNENLRKEFYCRTDFIFEENLLKTKTNERGQCFEVTQERELSLIQDCSCPSLTIPYVYDIESRLKF